MTNIRVICGLVLIAILAEGCVSPQHRREEDRSYVRTSNDKFERGDGGGSTGVVGIAKLMSDRAAELYPEVNATLETAKARHKKFTLPRVIRVVRPTYPLLARVFPAEGEIWVGFIVGTEGTVEEAQALTDADTAFGKAAVAAVKQWTFIPGRIDDVPARILVTVPMRFELNK